VAAPQQALEACLPVGTVRTIRILRPVLLLALIALVASTVLTSCGGHDNPSTSPSPSRAPTQTHTASPSPTATGLGSAEFESSRALAIARTLAVDIGVRAAGTDGEKRAANYIRDELSRYGYVASLQPFPIQSFVDLNTRVDLLSPEQREIEAAALGGSINTAVEGNLVAAGLGYPQQFPTGTAGAVVLVERGEIAFREKVANATTAGAAGVIIYNNENGAFVGQLGDESRIPAASISRQDGLTLADLVNSGGVIARLTVDARLETAESNNVVGRPPGGDCRLVIGGHYDSVPAGPGANDNASGTAVVVEMARAMAADGVFDDACFVLFGSEEIGLLGSAHHVASLAPAERDAIEAMLNFDMLAVGDHWPFGGSRSVLDIVAQQAETLSLEYSLETSLPQNAGSDHASFIDAGIPAVIFNCFCDPTWHTEADTFDRIQEQRLAEAGAMGLGTARALLDM
jgi:aminopeptidase YwaD